MALELDSSAPPPPPAGAPVRTALDALADAARAVAEGTSLGSTLDAVVAAAADAAGATVALARVLEPGDGRLCARAVHSGSAALAALLEGAALDPDEVGEEVDETGLLPAAVRAAAGHAGADAVLLVPVRVEGGLVGTLELLRPGDPFSAGERLLARVAADQVATALRAFRAPAGNGTAAEPARALELVGEALSAGADESRAAAGVARVAAHAARADACLVWRRGPEEEGPGLLAAFGPSDGPAAERGRRLAEQALSTRPGPSVDDTGPGTVVTMPLGQPAGHVLQLFFPEERELGEALLASLGSFSVRAAQAFRAADGARTLRVELERTRALLDLVAQASEELSLRHTLETAIERVANLLGADRIGVYLREDGRLRPAAGHALAGPHLPVAERLLHRALGPFRGRGILVVEDAASDPALAGLEAELASTRIEAAVAVPLLVPGEVVGLLAVFPPRGVAVSANEGGLLAAIAAQLAVAVQNAQLHEQATELGAELEQVLALERQAARQLGSLYEISRSFAQSLSLEATLEAVARTIVELLGVDAAVIRMPDARGELLVPRAVHVADARMEEAIRTVLSRPQPLAGLPRRLRAGRALVLDADSAARRESHQLLLPFLEKGSSAVVVPIVTPAELLGTIELLSLDPARALAGETVQLAVSVAAQAALAIDNARLYQHQKEFADTMQRSLLPQARPEVAGLDVGAVYAASARLDVGGDVYDFLELPDGRLAVVLGDVTGHGIDAAADMAMAKFVFRSLAREHPDPGAFLAAANDVVFDEVGTGKFITMLYVTVDPRDGSVGCASAGHPRPRLVGVDGSVRPLDVGGLALGIETGQRYEEARATLPPGASVVLYTDGVVEARRDGELYGDERLDAVLSGRRELDAGELALAILEDCRAWAGGELRDDCAIVVIRRTG